MKRIRSIVIGAAVIAAIAASSASAQPARSAAPVPPARVCWAWQNSCIQYRYIFGIRYCTAWKLTCIRWL
jgi:hypothetical protein